MFVKNQKLMVAGLSPSEGKVEQDGVRDRGRTWSARSISAGSRINPRKSTETESTLVVARGQGRREWGVTDHLRVCGFFWADEIFRSCIVVTVTQHCECTRCHCIVHCNSGQNDKSYLMCALPQLTKNSANLKLAVSH